MGVNVKKLRQGKILEIIQKHDVETQEELADRLRAVGLKVTQATVSRDIRELKLSKVLSSDGRQKYAFLKQEDGQLEDKFIRVLREGFTSMDMAQNILVVKTVSGMAMAVAAALDAIRFPEIVGSIAGDDTIFVAVRSREATAALMEKLWKLLKKYN